MTQVLKNRKGVTLVELLAVIVIMGIIAAIAVPAIGGLIDNARVKAYEGVLTSVEEAARVALSGDDLPSTATDINTALDDENYIDLGTYVITGLLVNESATGEVLFTGTATISDGKTTYNITISGSTLTLGTKVS